MKISKKKKILGVIPARGGSKGIPRKNLADLGGKPLLAWTIEAALRSKIDKVVVSSDDGEILAAAKSLGAEAIRRPDELCNDLISSDCALWHAVDFLREREEYIPDILVLLEPTSPLRTHLDIDGALSMLEDESVDAVISVFETDNKALKSFVLHKGRFLRGAFNDEYPFTSRQKLPKIHLANGAVYAIRRKIYMASKKLLAGRTVPFVMDEKSYIDINTLEDLKTAAKYLRSKCNLCKEPL